MLGVLQHPGPAMIRAQVVAASSGWPEHRPAHICLPYSADQTSLQMNLITSRVSGGGAVVDVEPSGTACLAIGGRSRDSLERCEPVLDG